MRKLSAALALFAIFTVCVAAPVWAEDRYNIVLEKQEKKEKARWSLADWLDTRDRMRMMDLWLALHSPAPYEFYFGTDWTTGKLDSGRYFAGFNFYAAAYAYIFGLEVQRNDATAMEGWTGLGHVRLFGMYNQATNLTISGGVSRQNRGNGHFWNPIAGVSLTAYMAKPAGIEASYFHTFLARESGATLFANDWRAGAFLEFKLVRFYAGYRYHREGGTHGVSYGGGNLGLRIYL